jgi:hypothetical protein
MSIIFIYFFFFLKKLNSGLSFSLLLLLMVKKLFPCWSIIESNSKTNIDVIGNKVSVLASKLDQCLMISMVQLHVILDESPLLPKKGKTKKKKVSPRFTVLGRWALQSGADEFCSFLYLLIQNIM